MSRVSAECLLRQLREGMDQLRARMAVDEVNWQQWMKQWSSLQESLCNPKAQEVMGMGAHEVFDDMPHWDRDAEQANQVVFEDRDNFVGQHMVPAEQKHVQIPSSVVWDGALQDGLDEMPCVDVVWDGEILFDVNVHSGLLEQLASGRNYKNDEKTNPPIDLEANEVITCVGNSSLFLEPAECNPSVVNHVTGERVTVDESMPLKSLIGQETRGKLIDTDADACLGRNDPNYDSGKEPYKLVETPVSTPLEDYKKSAVEYLRNDDVLCLVSSSPSLLELTVRIKDQAFDATPSVDTAKDTIVGPLHLSSYWLNFHTLRPPDLVSALPWLWGTIRCSSSRRTIELYNCVTAVCVLEQTLSLKIWQHLLVSRNDTPKLVAELIATNWLASVDDPSLYRLLGVADIYQVANDLQGKGAEMLDELVTHNFSLHDTESYNLVKLQTNMGQENGILSGNQANLYTSYKSFLLMGRPLLMILRSVRMQWDPGIRTATAWGQAVFRGGGNVMTQYTRGTEAQGCQAHLPSWPNRSPGPKLHILSYAHLWNPSIRKSEREKRERKSSSSSCSRDPIPSPISPVIYSRSRSSSHR